jgi:predicted kinase
MKLILIDGGPASGKNTLGELLVVKFQKLGGKAILLDLDAYVERYKPDWKWENREQEEKDQSNARMDFYNEVSKYLQEGWNVIAIGERFLTREDVNNFVSKIAASCTAYLFHLTVQYAIREHRLHSRGPHSLIDLNKDQQDRDAVKNWPGYVYENINSPEEDAKNIFGLIQQSKGLI